MTRHDERQASGPSSEGRGGAVDAGILRDQLADLNKGIFIAMAVGTVLSALILAVQLLCGGSLAAVPWFAVIALLNGARMVLALSRTEGGPEAAAGRLSLYGVLALASGVAWSFLALLTDGYATPQAPLYLIVLAGISAGSVTYGAPYAPASINFIMLPLLTAAACVLAHGGAGNYVLGFTILLFLGT
ncbi:MAG: GGDEF-domain containing protein, partial [Alphaproteobacteria bacterium]|nr:GGDEF-domain containing protein [Alphaproteobacteria bacterium]